MASSLNAVLLLQAIPEGGELGEAPLPGGIAAVVRFFLSFPQPLQVAGLVVGVVVGMVAVVLLWRRRAEIRAWFRDQDRIVYAAMAAIGIAMVVVAVAGGISTWNYTQHDNAFCTGCHVMGPAYVRFTESEHNELECHDCHQQPVTASMRQLYLWVAQRPEEIGPHAPVSNNVCVRCHVREDADDSWEAIREMQGHRVHLESDSAALTDVQCVTCHGEEVHRFTPARQTCGQSDCHSDEADVVLGEMASSETTFHCVACHDFTAPLEPAAQPEGTGPVGRQAAMMPKLENCSSCHAMDAVIEDLSMTGDPHEAECGWCHNPHAQEEPAESWNTCTDSGCHTDPRELTTFHQGVHSEGAVPDCSTCHEPHTWELDGDDCLSCHDVDELP